MLDSLKRAIKHECHRIGSVKQESDEFEHDMYLHSASQSSRSDTLYSPLISCGLVAANLARSPPPTLPFVKLRQHRA